MTTISGPRPGLAPAVELDLCRAEVGAGYLWVQYRVTPVPEAVRARPRVRDLDCGEARWAGGAFTHCRASYRVGLDAVHVDGVLAVGPCADLVAGSVEVSFTPLPGVPGFDAQLCALDAELTAGVVVRVGAHLL